MISGVSVTGLVASQGYYWESVEPLGVGGANRGTKPLKGYETPALLVVLSAFQTP